MRPHASLILMSFFKHAGQFVVIDIFKKPTKCTDKTIIDCVRKYILTLIYY